MDDRTGLEQMICFELYAASRALTGLYRPALEAAGLTYPQFVAMRVLHQRGDTTVTELGTLLGLDSGTLSPLLKRLETQGHIVRTRAGTDARKVHTRLSDTGEQLYQQVADLPARLGCALDLTTDEFATLSGLLTRLRSNATTTTL